APKLVLIEYDVLRMSSAAVVVAAVVSGSYSGCDTMMVAGPGLTPLSVTSPVVDPAGIVAVVLARPTFDASEVVMVIVGPPAGAGVGSVMLTTCTWFCDTLSAFASASCTCGGGSVTVAVNVAGVVMPAAVAVAVCVVPVRPGVHVVCARPPRSVTA